GRKSRALDAAAAPPHAHCPAALSHRLRQFFGHIRADRIGHGDMRNHPAFKKGADASFGLIQELMRDDDLARLKRLLHAADRADRDDPLRTDLLERINVGAVVDLGWREAVMAAVAREKGDSRSFQIADDQSIRWLTKGRLHPDFSAV